MQVLTAVTQKGQVTLPRAVREKLGIKVYGKVVVEAYKDHIKIKPTEDVVDLAGTFKTKVRKSPIQAREEMEKAYERV